MGGSLPRLALDKSSRNELETLCRQRVAKAALVFRAKLILLAGSGCSNAEIARRMGCLPHVAGHS